VSFGSSNIRGIRVLGIHADGAMTDTVLVDARRVRGRQNPIHSQQELTHERRLRDVILEDIEKSGNPPPVLLAAALLQHPPATLRH
jgi:hypothetical protein